MIHGATCSKLGRNRWPTLLMATGFLSVLSFEQQSIYAEEGTSTSRNSGSIQNAFGSRAFIDGKGESWIGLEEKDFVNVNCSPDTWAWDGNLVHCTGDPIGILRSATKYTNFELVLEWCHLKSAGNSGVFIWIPAESIVDLEPNQLPAGIEIQILDHGYKVNYEKAHNTKVDWFSTHGDVFPVGTAAMKPFPPVSPNGVRFLPRTYPTDMALGITTTFAVSMEKYDYG